MRTRNLAVIAVTLVLSLQAAGCATLPGGSAGPEETVWTSREQFVRLVAAEEPADGRPNDSPQLLPRQLEALLAPLRVTADGRTSDLFEGPQRQLLAEQLAPALRTAGPGRDAVFAITGYAPALLGLVRRPFVTTGRVFVREGRLNLILGMVHEEIRESDRRLQPFVPGSRLTAAAGSWRLSSATGEATFREGRGDWLVLAIPDATALPAAAAPAAAAPPAPPAPPAARGADQRERLLRLKSLREADLINEDEYRAKRKEILDSL